MEDAERIKNQYMSTSLDDIVKANRTAAKKGRGFNKNNNNNNNNNNSGEDQKTTTSPTTTSPKLNVLESSLDDIVKSQRKPYIKKTHHQHQHQQQHNNNGVGQYKITIRNNGMGGARYGGSMPYQGNINGAPQFQNRGLFSRNQLEQQQQQQPLHNNRFFNNNRNSLQYGKRYAHNNNNSNKLKNIPRTSITDSIDHKFFDPRGIRDYSQVKKPNIISMDGNKNSNGNNGLDDSNDVDEPEFDEKGNELSFSVKVVNLPKTIIASDIAYMFGVIGSLKDFDLDTNTCTAIVVFKKKAHALASIKRYSGVELDGSLLILYEAENPPPTTTTTTTTTNDENSTTTNNNNNNEENITSTSTTTTTTSEKQSEIEMEE